MRTLTQYLHPNPKGNFFLLQGRSSRPTRFRQSLSDKIGREQRRRRRILATFARRRNEGLSVGEAVSGLRCGRTSLWRYQRAFATGGAEALQPGFARSGRKPSFDPGSIHPSIIAAVARKAVELDSVAGAWRWFAKHPSCPPKLAARLAGAIPPGIRSLVQLTRWPGTLVTCQVYAGFFAAKRSPIGRAGRRDRVNPRNRSKNSRPRLPRAAAAIVAGGQE